MDEPELIQLNLYILLADNFTVKSIYLMDFIY